MAKPLLVRTDRSPAKKVPLSGGAGLPQLCTTAAQVLVHVVPEGYRDELYLWANNNDAANDGQILVEFNATAALSIIGTTLNRAIDPIVIDGMVLEARTGDVDVDVLALIEPLLVWGYVIRTAIES